MKKEIIATANAPAAIGPYSQGVKCGQLVFVSGQIPLNPKTGELVAGDISTQTRQVLGNIEKILHAVESSLHDVVKITVFLKNMDDFAKMNETYATFFSNSPPARATVEVSRLPKDVDVEIEAVAIVGEQSAG